MPTKLEKLIDTACGRADPATAEEIRREAAEPDSETMQFVRALSRAASNPLGIAGMPPLDSLECAAVDEEIDALAARATSTDDSTGSDIWVSERQHASAQGIYQLAGHLGRRPLVRWIATGAGIASAACLLVALGAFVAPKILGSGTEILVASASPVYGNTRGAGRVPRVEMRSDLAGYATVIALVPDRRPEVYPGPGAEDIAITASVPREYGPLPPATSRVLFIVTETPAGETVRKALRGKAYGPNSLGRLKADLTASLRDKGFRRMALGDAAFRGGTE